MRTVLRHYFRPDRTEFERLWKDALISFDASALLNLYGYSDQTRDNLIEVIKSYAHRSRLPYQFAREYARNRASTIIKQIKNYHDTERDFAQIASKRLQPKREHPFLTSESAAAFASIQKELESKRQALEAMVNFDEYADVLLASFEKKIGPAPDKTTTNDLYKTADARYSMKTPPGYMDAKDKDIPDRYGDYIGWRQLMDIAKAEGKDFILVIDDFKEDWWQKEGERTIGPRPELLEEFFSETKQSVWMYTSESFLIAAKEYDSSGVEDEVIKEVGARLDAQKAELAETKLKAIDTDDGKMSRAAKLLQDISELTETNDKVSDEKASDKKTSEEKNSDKKAVRADDMKLKSRDAGSGDE